MPRRCNRLNDQASLIYIVLVFVECYLKSDEDGGILRSGPSEEPRVDHREDVASRAVVDANLKGGAMAISEDELL